MKALLSVYDKTGLEELASFLAEQGYELISSGGTYKFLKDLGFNVAEVSEHTGFPEMLDGRVKTLHPKIHGGLLALRDKPEHMQTIKEYGIDPIDLVCVNLYPFFEKSRQDLGFDETIEFIDIGGPSMLRSAAKNHKSVFVLSDPSQYDEFIKRLRENSADATYRASLAADVFQATSAYDAAIANWLTDDKKEFLSISAGKGVELRYGENPHQKAMFFENLSAPGFMSEFEILGGKALSYINYKDIDASYGVVLDFSEPACCAVKHNTPCGVALGKDATDAYVRCYECDPVSIFGGVVALNREVNEATASEMTKTFLEVIVAPSYTEEALAILRKKKNLRIIKINHERTQEWYVSSVNGGFVAQEQDTKADDGNLQIVTKAQPSTEDLADMLFAQKVVKHVKSNAIVVVKDKQTLGIGGGFTNRVDAAQYALDKAQGKATVLASDAFFPFDDTVRAAGKAGIRAIIQPGGSVRDEDSLIAADEYGIAMAVTGVRHFRH